MARFQVFDGFPYLITRIVPALYHVTLLPGGQPEETLLALAQAQADANRLQMCLVLGPRRGVYFDVDARAMPSNEPPRGGALIAGRLAPPVDLRLTDEMRARKERLDMLVEAVRRKGGYITGDPSKGGREATPEELTSLAGLNDDGSPRGLERCDTCHDWHGLCLDPSERFRGQVMPVHCLCENHNRCARCGELLHDRRLNGNCYDPADRTIWHTPGFSGLSHECPRVFYWDAPGPAESPDAAEASRGGTADPETSEGADDEYPRYRAEVYFRSNDGQRGFSVFCTECGSRVPRARPGVLFDARAFGCTRCGRPIVT